MNTTGIVRKAPLVSCLLFIGAVPAFLAYPVFNAVSHGRAASSVFCALFLVGFAWQCFTLYHHPRRVLQENLTYLQRHADQMNYPTYRAKGWPIGSGVTESGVKLFNKRVKGTEQFWNEAGAESMLALRALRLSQDERWHHYWLWGYLPRKAA